MTEDTVRHLAQQDPTPQMVARFGELQLQARSQLDALTTTLRAIDKTAAELADRNITVSVDLGHVGNQAAAARRDLEKRNGKPEFVMPRG
jgi:hypothetical protein